ncbi:hypothetical protein CspeluHIS016_0800990 [Cutaneotrichosporon spelunceum]|uniref:Ricin B lectin domain-containing protein n=1 Tax=Cutaneotrichosporon spelunceum TaxID=1672016 RepID=A0AAD3TZ94_9TREE|nr:hypothetical protein CspeluHIS016_0800990 [Cutaneotrichosporon spelunceum]
MFAFTLALLASLVVAAPAPADEGHLVNRAYGASFRWRHGGNPGMQRTLVTCGGGPGVGYNNGDKVSLGSPVTRYCNPSWEVGNNHIISVNDPKRCLDSTLNPGNGVQPHLWECLGDVPQQKWTYRKDGTIRLEGKNLCLDVTDGNAANKVQMWECDPNNPNQQWDRV